MNAPKPDTNSATAFLVAVVLVIAGICSGKPALWLAGGSFLLRSK